MSALGLISSDSHIVEPPDLWTARMDRRLRERAPRVVREADGDWWYIDGKRSMSFLGVQTGDRFVKDATELIIVARFEHVRPAAHDPHAFVAENLRDGVVGSVLYPSEGLLAYGIPDSELCSAVMAAYNDFIAEFCAAEPRNLKGIALINVDDPQLAVRELERCRKLGLVGAMISVLPVADRSYDLPLYEPLWSAAVDLGMPLAMHVATGRAAASVDARQQGVTRVSPSAFYLQDHFVRKSLGEMIFSGVFERHPELRVGSVEHEVAWIPFFLAQMDYTYTDRPVRGDWHRFADPERLPSHFFRSQCFVSFQEDTLAMRMRDVVGVETLMWGSDYPHTESTFPGAGEVLGEILGGLPDGEGDAIVRENARALFGFDADLRAPA